MGLFGAVVMLAVWHQLLWSPQGASLASAHSRQRSATAALFTAQQRVGHLHRLSTQAQQLNAVEAGLAAAVPAQDQIDGFLVALTGDAQSAGVSIGTIGLSPASTSTAGASLIPVQLSVAGGYFAIQRFLRELRDSPRLVVIDSVSLSTASSGPAGSGDGTPLGASIRAEIFMNTGGVSVPAVAITPASGGPAARAGTGVLETPINAAKSTAAAASAAGANQSRATP
jgi:Tfp pilus assembly protein PilO